jgi:hypothetical protein
MIAHAAMNSLVECERICGPLSLMAIITGTPSASGPSSSTAVASPLRRRASSRASIRSASCCSSRAARNAASIWLLVSSAGIRFVFDGTTEYYLNCQHTAEKAGEVELGCEQVVRTFKVD